MITSVKPTSGYANELPLLKDRTFEFTPGLNILFGPNGCGKSTLLRLMAGYNFISHHSGGWSRYQSDVRGKDFPDALKELTPGGCTAEVGWDGSSTFMYDSGRLKPNMAYFVGGADESDDGLTDMNTQMSMIMNKPSEGQFSLIKLGKFMQALGQAPDLSIKPDREWFMSQYEYVQTLPRDGVRTLLMDEPERGLSIELQARMFKEIIPNLAQKHQVIMTSHNPFILLKPPEGANVIDMTPHGFVDSFVAAIMYLDIDIDVFKKNIPTSLLEVFRNSEAAQSSE